MSDTATSIAIIASNFFGLPIECVSEYDGGVQYRITSPVFGKGRGVSLLITRPYRQKYSAIAIFDTFSTQLINVWKAMDDEVLTCAAQYLESYADRLSVDIDIREHQLNSAEGIAQAMRELRTPADFFLSKRLIFSFFLHRPSRKFKKHIVHTSFYHLVIRDHIPVGI